MENQRKEPIPYRPTLKDVRRALRFMFRFQKHPEELEPFLAGEKSRGLPDDKVNLLRDIFVVSNEARVDPQTAWHLDQFLLTGMGAVDLILLSVVLPMGTPDRPLFVATLALAMSIVFTAVSLFVAFVKRNEQITVYGWIHSGLVFLSLLTGAGALVGVFWHASTPVGIVLAITTATAYIGCAFYFLLVRFSVRYILNQLKQQHSAAEASALIAEEPTS